MTFLNKIFMNKKNAKESSTTKKNKKNNKCIKNIFSKNIFTKSLNESRRNTRNTNRTQRKPMAAPKIYSKDDIITAIPLQENIKARSRSHSISYNLRPTFNSILTPDEKTFRPTRNINIKVNVFWGEDHKREQVYLSIPRTSSYNSLKKLLSETLGYK